MWPVYDGCIKAHFADHLSGAETWGPERGV
jgi:hypothetical protein